MEKCLLEEKNTLKKAEKNQLFKIINVKASLGQNIVRRLGDLGIYVGAEIKILKKSFFGKTFLVCINGYTLSFRDVIAKLIEVKKAA